MNFVLSKIKHCNNSLNTDLKLKLSRGVIDPFFDYCAILYHGFGVNGTGGDQNRLRILYNSCIRFECNLSGRDHIFKKLIELIILNAHNRRCFQICVIIHSFIQTGRPSCLCDIFNKNISYTRAVSDTITLTTVRVLNTRNELLLANSACQLWNSIPFLIRNIDSKNEFSKRIEKYLF